MLNDKYGDLLDKAINKPSDSTAMDAVNRFRDGMNKQKQKEIDKHNRMESEKLQKDLAEQERLNKQNEFISSMLEKRQKKIDSEVSRRKAGERERQRAEESRKAAENLSKIDNIVAKHKERREREKEKAELDSRRKW